MSQCYNVALTLYLGATATTPSVLYFEIQMITSSFSIGDFMKRTSLGETRIQKIKELFTRKTCFGHIKT